jgi:hypothetical protein
MKNTIEVHVKKEHIIAAKDCKRNIIFNCAVAVALQDQFDDPKAHIGYSRAYIHGVQYLPSTEEDRVLLKDFIWEFDKLSPEERAGLDEIKFGMTQV